MMSILKSTYKHLRASLGNRQAYTQATPLMQCLLDVAQPMVAMTAIITMAYLLAMGVVSFACFMCTIALVYAILTHVFGIELGLRMPFATR